MRTSAPHSQSRLPAPSSKLCRNSMVTPLKRHSSSAQLSTDAASALRKARY